MDKTRREQEYKLPDLKGKSREELAELLERQKKILQNRRLLAQLPDKGEHVKQTKEKIEAAIKECESVTHVTEALSALRLKNVVEGIEWTSQELSPATESEHDDERNPFKLLSGQGDAEKTPSIQKPVKEKFLPHRTLKVSAHTTTPVHCRTPQENTAATPPPSKFESAMTVSLEESLRLQKEQAARMREVQLKQAAEKLRLGMHIKMGEFQPEGVLHIDEYREQPGIIREDDD